MHLLLRGRLAELHHGPARSLGPVTLVPLLGPDLGEPVSLLDEDSATVEEVHEGGVVGRVRVKSRSLRPLLLLAGEVLVGAKQNRLVNATTLIRPCATHELAVSCVERGRWSYGRTRGFHSRAATVPWSLRSRASYRSSRSKRRRHVSDAGQRRVWTEVDSYLHRQRIRSETDDLTAAMERVDLDRLLADWSPGADEVGAALFVGDRLVGMECFGRRDTWALAARRVLAGAFLDPAGADRRPEDPTGTVTDWLRRLDTLEVEVTQGDALGEELHGDFLDGHVVALVHDDAVVHLRIAFGDMGDTHSASEFELTPSRIRRIEARALERLHARHAQHQTFIRDHLARGPGSPPADAPHASLAFLPLPETVWRELMARDPDSTPLPDRHGAGVVLWMRRSPRALRAILAVLQRTAAQPLDTFVIHASMHTDRPLPDWLGVAPSGGSSVVVWRRH